MDRLWRSLPASVAFLSLVALTGQTADAGLFEPRAAPQDVTAASSTAFQPDPVISRIDAIGQPSGPQRITELPIRRPVERTSGAEGTNEAIFPGGIASAVGGLRVLEGVMDARDPLQLLPPEPSVALRVPAPASAALLLGAVLSLAVLRRRSRRRGTAT